MISVSWSLTRQSHGEQPYWAAIALACIIGDLGKPGGGIGFGYSAMNSIGNHYKKIPAVSLVQGKQRKEIHSCCKDFRDARKPWNQL